MNTKDLIRLGVPVGEQIKLARASSSRTSACRRDRQFNPKLVTKHPAGDRVPDCHWKKRYSTRLTKA